MRREQCCPCRRWTPVEFWVWTGGRLVCLWLGGLRRQLEGGSAFLAIISPTMEGMSRSHLLCSWSPHPGHLCLLPSAKPAAPSRASRTCRWAQCPKTCNPFPFPLPLSLNLVVAPFFLPSINTSFIVYSRFLLASRVSLSLLQGPRPRSLAFCFSLLCPLRSLPLSNTARRSTPIFESIIQQLPRSAFRLSLSSYKLLAATTTRLLAITFASIQPIAPNEHHITYRISY